MPRSWRSRPSGRRCVSWAALFDPPADGPPPHFEAVLAHIDGRLGRAPRYRQKLAAIPLGLGDPVWVDAPDFHVADHVRRAPRGDFGRLVDEVKGCRWTSRALRPGCSTSTLPRCGSRAPWRTPRSRRPRAAPRTASCRRCATSPATRARSRT
ncbi:MAG TPA: wax ester/triacylglycerol synthase domain-containing protein [Solirubrobacteraceae bacterium]|nr:wax ester/triacylglycerol synthase domain-containing protein [Solirubrobacteraceae bacterium]